MELKSFSLVILGLIACAGLLEASTEAPAPKCDDDSHYHLLDKYKIDCHPDDNVTLESCEARGCCFDNGVTKPTIPRCWYPKSFTGYKVQSVSGNHEQDETQNLVIMLTRAAPSGIRDEIQKVKVEVIPLTEDTVRIRFTDAEHERYEPPVPHLNLPKREKPTNDYKVEVTQDNHLVVTRKSTGVKLFDANLQLLIYTDQLIQLYNKLPNKYLYGLGEHKDVFRKELDSYYRYTFHTRDIEPIEYRNLYGYHAMYLTFDQEGRSDAHGVWLLNSNAMDVDLYPTRAIAYKTIGGILDFFVFTGPEPKKVVSDYIDLVGKPILPPFWSLGFQLCRWGYKDVDEMRAVLKRTLDAGIPFDVHWSDIDYMKLHDDFTIDPQRYSELPKYVDELHAKGLRYVMIEDPGVSGGAEPGTYPPYDLGMELDLFIKNASGQVLYGKVWNDLGKTVFPDFTHPNATYYWTKMLKDFHDKVKYDGVWIDMNEPSNFGADGSLVGCPMDSPLESPPMTPGHPYIKEPLMKKTICMTAKQHLGVHYNLHSLFSFFESMATNKALREIMPNKRPFIISRSQFAGHGHWAGHWDGDVSSSWDHMRWTIASIMEMNMFGIPLMGADICGFLEEPTIELCARWQELGAFYPFSRNHNVEKTKDQDPASLGPVVVNSTINSLNIRYQLLAYYYTQFFKAHTQAETVFKPLFLEFPDDETARSLEYQFMIGPSVTVAPVVFPSHRQVSMYLPAGRWYHFEDHYALQSRPTADQKGSFFTLDAPLGKINVMVRGGSILPLLPPGKSTTELRQKNFRLLVALDEHGEAHGDLFWDDGESFFYQKGLYSLIEMTASNGTLTVKAKEVGSPGDVPLDTITVLGVQQRPEKVYLDYMPLTDFEFDQTLKKLTIKTDKPKNMKKLVVLRWA